MIKNSLNKLYYLAGGAFLFALIKYVFIRSEDLSPKFFIFEFISYGLFLVVIYLFDRSVREHRKEQKQADNLVDELKSTSEEKILYLEKEIKELKSTKEVGYEGSELGKSIDYIANIKNDKEIGKHILIGLAKDFDFCIGIIYFNEKSTNKFIESGTYGLGEDVKVKDFTEGEGLNGQCVLDKKVMEIIDIDEDYFNIESCSGTSKPKNIYLLPINYRERIVGLIEIASFASINIENHWDNLNNKITDVISL